MCWSEIIEGGDDEHSLAPDRPYSGQWDGPRAGFAAYTNMEVIHHGAEVGLIDLALADLAPGP